MKPLKFRPILKSVLWGGNRIAAFKRLNSQQHQIGESWEISAVNGHESVVAEGEDMGKTLPELITQYREKLVGKDVLAQFGTEFPLLIKLIDAHQDLSVQVHPDDRLAALRHGCRGKTEMWYVIDSEPQACILAGFNQPVTLKQYDQLVAQGNILDVVAKHDSSPGDVFFLPPGTIHSIGAGNLVAEIQQTSDITYRVYDYNRQDAMGNLRELHTQLAREAIDYSQRDDYTTPYDRTRHGETRLISCKQFVASRIVVNGRYDIDWTPMRTFLVLICLDGQVDVLTDGGEFATTMHRGETILVPACTKTIGLEGDGVLLTAKMPFS